MVMTVMRYSTKRLRGGNPLKKHKLITPKEITAVNLRRHLGEILDQVANKHERFLVKRAGIPAAIVLSATDYKNLEELVDTWYEQQDPRFQSSLVEARQEIEEGKVVSLGDLRRDLEAKERRRKKRS
jgi:prevent-host-death family protein